MEGAIGLKIVTVGGGTGGFVLNRGLRRHLVSRTGICTVFDSGGSTGHLRDAYGALPGGDLRRLLLAMIGDNDDRSDTFRRLLSFRFPKGNDSPLHKHSLGNLLIYAVEKEWGRLEGLRRLSDLLDIKGTVLPISIDDAHLCAELDDGTVVKGETNIDTRDPHDFRGISRVYLEPRARILPEAAEALINADIIVLGPGDHFTSLMPNVLVEGFADAVSKSSARLVYVSNLMTKMAETRDYTLVDFAGDFVSRYGVGRNKFDAIIYNTRVPPEETLQQYQKIERATPVPVERPIGQDGRLEQLADRVIEGDFLSETDLTAGLIRHDGQKLARAILSL